MTRKSLLLFLNSFLLLLMASTAVVANGLPDFTKLVEKNAPAVVNISTRQNLDKDSLPYHKFYAPDLGDDNPLNDLLKHFFGKEFNLPDLQQRNAKSLGSGFIISSDGYILTNHHVVKKADEILVRLNDRREYLAKLIGSDKASDIALIKIDATNLPVTELGKSSKLKVGEWVLAIGSPFGFDHSVTAGIVSAKGRNLPNENYVPYIQTDVAINPGNSGGPLFNLDGEVVGVNSQIYSRSGGFMGLSFSIPIEIAMNVVEQLKATGHVKRGYLGVLIQDVTRELAESFHMKRPRGALITRIMPDTPAEKYGLAVGDVILRFNGREILQSSDLPPLVGATPLDEPAKVEILRKGKRKIISISVQELPEAKKLAKKIRKKEAIEKDRTGLVIDDLTPDMRKKLGVSEKSGILVVDVKPGVAALAGIQKGDVILQLNNRIVRNVKDYHRIMSELEPGRNVAVLIQRDDGALFLAMKIPLEE